MKTTELRGFTEELLRAHGADVVGVSQHLLRVAAGTDLAERLGRRDLALAFTQRGLQEDPSSELATVGNPVFDRILELAVETGRIGIRYLPETSTRRGNGTKPPRLARGLVLGDAEPAYAPLYYHVFKLQYSVEETPDSLEVVGVDGIALEPESQTPDLVELWTELESTPARGRSVPSVLPVPDEVLRIALSALERRLRRRIGRLKRDAETHLVREGENIGTYYQNLIEEARTSKRKLAGGLQAREDKIRILQLDWKRRMEEAQEFWSPKVDIQLSGLGVVLRPSLKYSVLRGTEVVGSLHGTENGFLVPKALAGGTV